MRLKKLEIYGFKSFAQRTEIVFDEGITGIVGPNGSGKSNIGDAVRWVLGEQSARLLRGARMEDVIFNGTEKRKPMAYCEVSLVFDNEDHALPVDFSEVMVTRRVYRNGESEYYLNKTACRLKDIIELFRDTGIGKEGYSIIGQGRIDEILSQKGEDRRLVFEEAAGIVKFKARKDEAQKKLARTLDNLSRVEDILEEISSRLGPLEEQAAIARAYQALATELESLELNIFLIRHDKMKARIGELDQLLAGLEAVLADAMALLADKNQARESLEIKLENLENQITQARQLLSQRTELWHEEKARGVQLAEQMAGHQANSHRLEGEKQAALNRLQELQALEQASDTGVDVKGDALKQARAEWQAAEETMELAQLAQDKAETDLEEHKAAILEAMNRLSQAQNMQTRQQTVKAQMEQRLKELNAGEAQLNETLAQLEANLAAAGEMEKTASDEFEQLRQEAQKLDQQVSTLGQRMQQDREEYQRRLSGRQALVSRLKLMEEMARDFEGYNQAVKRALQYAKNSDRKDVKGVVAMLLHVPQHLETAIDMVLGAALQNIVTEDENTAKDMIHYLRENRLGRATFLPMNTIRGRVLTQEERKVLTMPGCVGLASELVSFAPEYRGIVENLLGRTVIAENLDAGIAIMRAGRHAFRLVTLSGDVMHSGGSMTGGSTQSRATNLLGREREIKEQRENLTRLEKELNRQQEELLAKENQRQELKRLRDEATNAMHQQEIAVAREQERLGAAQSELAAHRQRMETTAQAQAQLTDSLQQINEELERIAQQTGSVELDKEAMQQKTTQLQQALASAREALDNAREELTQRMLSHNSLEHELESLTRDRERLKHEMEKASADVTRLTAELEAQHLAEEANAAEQALCEEQQALKGQAVEAANQAVEALENQRTDCQNQARTLQREMDEIREANQQDLDKQHRAEIQKTRVESDLKAMQERIWNTYNKTYATAMEAKVDEPFDLPASERRAGHLRSEIKAMGTVNVAAIQEYAETKARFEDLSTQQQDLKKAEGDLNELIERLLGQMEKQFVSQFELLKGYFEETFVRLFGGGHAELKLSDPEDALNCGIEVIAQPPGKKLQLLSLLSGGERALTAIAILLAMLKLKPTPFCILDEIEAALDEANVGYFADYLLEYSKDTQFVVVSHRKGTMERCNALYGVAMEERGVSKMVSVNLRDYD